MEHEIQAIVAVIYCLSDLNSAYSSVFFFIREIYYGWSLRYLHSSGASFVFLFLKILALIWYYFLVL